MVISSIIDKMKRILITILTATLAFGASAQDYIFNRAPLAPTQFAELPIGAIKAEGWLH